MSVKLINNAMQRKAIATPVGNPPPGSFYEYFKSDGKLYRKDSSGSEKKVSTSQISARLFTQANQSTANAVWETINWEIESYDTNDLHDIVVNNSRITIPDNEDGRYLISASLSLTANATGDRRIRIQKNGATTERRVVIANAGIGSFVTATIFDELDLVAGDFIEVESFQNSGGALTLRSGSDVNHFLVRQVHSS